MLSKSNNKFVTPKETKKKYCPFALKSFSECMGEQCMSWRWTGYTKETQHVVTQSQEALEHKGEYITERILTHGCCGLTYGGGFNPHEMV